MLEKKSSWRTTTAGWAGALGLLLVALGAVIDGDPTTQADWAGVVQAVGGLGLLGGFSGLLAARDDKAG